MGDSPCHGRQFHDLDAEMYMVGDKYGRDIGKVLRMMRELDKVSCYTFCHLNDTTHKMLREFKKALGGGAQASWIQQETFLDDDMDNIPHKVVAVAKLTIASTVAAAIQGHTAVISWSGIVRQRAKQLRMKWYETLDQLLRAVNTCATFELEEMPDVDVQVAPHPFSFEGSEKFPHYAQVTNVETNATSLMVVKRFRWPCKEHMMGACYKWPMHSKGRYMEQMEAQCLAAQMAHEFNKKIEHLPGSKQLIFPMVTTLEVIMTSHDGQNKFYNMEKVMKGSWIKRRENADYVNTPDYAATLQAFSHWTEERSFGQLLVTDLQGVRVQRSGSDSELWLCHPVIHCLDSGRFPSTNDIWPNGIDNFFASHKCNDICRTLKLNHLYS